MTVSLLNYIQAVQKSKSRKRNKTGIQSYSFAITYVLFVTSSFKDGMQVIDREFVIGSVCYLQRLNSYAHVLAQGMRVCECPTFVSDQQTVKIPMHC